MESSGASPCRHSAESSFDDLLPEYYRSRENSGADVRIFTSGGPPVLAHSSILASVSPVFENYMERFRRNGRLERIPIMGVPREPVLVFLRFAYTSRFEEEEMKKYGFHLLVLAHAFSLPTLKRACIRALAESLTVANVVDVMQLARLCDAPHLYLKCLKLIAKDFSGVAATEGWRFLQNNDPWLELEILQYLSESESREKRRVRKREEERVYLQLSEAMEALFHICTEGCKTIGPYEKDLMGSHGGSGGNDGGVCRFSTCKHVERLIRHFASCERRVRGGCSNCKRMWQLLQLHSFVCDEPESCRVPLCSVGVGPWPDI
ncbi:BTB/POZ and TAZ domain-containing protein 1 [Nymphaea thermarum]|nr:BTB/POZ and TAZ domain-containing protein 1 [Nymphaea thermarum]